ncbi:RagB/SusD family nutrient uptake outer membrane protein [Allomuricauda sp. XS_ASV26]|uniref:Membrane protein n=1 Tax=Flagellimonas marinaquae TaxID=254955 RepID=A0AA48KP54_9FLAO|nr:RagB/SusD family nutrient uptake outer membrane protein [Allomuricauda aquimarina]USD24491.1 RagB/SusD family nutrient uptake outer membrane protein [Allomuricauda aquimarina]BDW93528.1 membrane protein [Allomuricauda aquimarina]
MKNIVQMFVASMFMFAILSCDDDEFLEQQSPDQLTSSSFWRNVEDAESGLVAAYSELESRSNFWDGWQEGRPVVEYFRSDYALPGPDASNYAHWMSIFNFNYTNGHTFLNVLWTTNYKGLNFANQVISKVGQMTPEQISEADKNRIIAEAKFLRGYYHFKLLSLYEQIIVRMEELSPDNLDSPLSTRPEAWQVILQDFQEAASNLPETRTDADTGRATKGTALAYLGKAYLYKAGDASSAEGTDMDNAVAALEQVVESGVYDLFPDFVGNFNGENENNQEAVFELQFKSGDATSWNANRLHAFIGDWCIGGWGGIEASYDLVDLMKSEGMIASNGLYDNRLYGTLYFKDDYYNDTETNAMQGFTWDVLVSDTYGSPDAKDGSAYFRKWLPNYVWDNGYIGINLTLMRYADVLLMYAEALNETGSTALAIPIINEIREVHGLMPPTTASTQEEVREQIIHERIMELTLESTRFFDLRRWGMLDQAMQAAGRSGFSAAEHSYFPVPLSEIQANPMVGE